MSSAQASSGSVAGPPTGEGGSGSKGAPSPRRAPLPDQQAAAEVQPQRWPGMGRSRSPMTKRLQKKVTSVVLKAASECVPPAKGPPTTPLVSPRGTADDEPGVRMPLDEASRALPADRPPLPGPNTPLPQQRKMPSSLRLPTQFQDIREHRERTLERRVDDRTDTRGVGTRRAGANVDRDASAARQPTAAAAASSTCTESGVAQPAKGQMTQSGSTRPPSSPAPTPSARSGSHHLPTGARPSRR